MAPDLNSLPPSPYRQHSSHSIRRPSDLRATSPAFSPSHPYSPTFNPREHASSISSNHGVPPGDNTGVDVGPGPMRHPRPLTAADLHMQLEKEQEAVVNRLQRELTLLRQQTASVVSTTSSTSTGVPDGTDSAPQTGMLGASHPTPSRRHRSSSNLSTRSATTAATGITAATNSTVGTTAGIAGSTTSGIAPPREPTTSHPHLRDTLSRQSSVASRISETSSPPLSSSFHQGDQIPFHTHRHSSSISSAQNPAISQQTTNPGSSRSSYTPGGGRYEEVYQARAELEAVKRENEALRRRVRELERNASSQRQPGTDLSRSESVNTNASVPRPLGRSRAADEDEDAVNVGESAGSVGFGGGQ